MAQKTYKKELRISQRFSDKATFIILVLGVFIAFLICLGIYIYEFEQTASFWGDAAKCISKQNFQCIMEIRTDEEINKDLLLTLLGANLSFLGLIFGFLAVTIYKSYHFQDKCCGGEREVC